MSRGSHNWVRAVCAQCGQSCPLPAGNWNLAKVALCSKKCKRERKTKLQRDRRSQLIMDF